MTSIWKCSVLLAVLKRQARKLNSGPSPTTKTRLLSFNRTQTRVVIGLLARYNTQRRHLYLMWLTTLYASGMVQRKKPQSTFCVSVKLWLLVKHAYSGFLLYGP